MKKALPVIIIVIIVLALGYVGRHKIKAMLGMSSTAPAASQTDTMASSAPTASATPMAMADVIKTMSDAKKGSFLTDGQGKTLYMFDKDTKGVSNCIGTCLTTWPPYKMDAAMASSAMPANVDSFKRSDGTMQYTYKGMPLYYYSGDSKAGDMNGDGVQGLWHLVKP